MQFHPQPVRAGCGKNLRDFLRRKSNALAKPIDSIGQPLSRDLRDQSLAKQPNISVTVGQKLRWQRMRAQKRCRNIDRAVLPNLADHPQEFQLRILGKPVTGFNLHRGHALGQQRIQPWQARRVEFLRTGLPCRPHGRGDTAPGTRDLFIGGTLQPCLELRHAARLPP